MKFKKFIVPALCMAMLSMGCSDTDPVEPNDGNEGGTNENVENGLQVTTSTTVINANGQDAARIKVYYDKVEQSLDAVAFYDAKSNDALDLSKFTTEGNTLVYTATEPGDFSFWVAYKTHNTKDRPTTISAVEFSVPDAPEDPQPDNTSFVHRVLITQFTGLGCGYCPFMIAALEDVRKSDEYADKFVLAACHTYSGDPFQPDVALDNAMGVNSYPYVNFDFQTGFGNFGYNSNVSNIKKNIDKSLSVDAGAGISVGMEVSGNQLVARAMVKASRSGSFRVGAWVLENGLTGTQANYGMKGDYEFNTHNNVIRHVNSRYSGSDYSGYEVGALAAGGVGEHLFTITLDKNWNVKNCHVVFFVTELVGKGYVVTNAIDIPAKSCSIPFEYK